MRIVYDKVKDGIRILRCFGYDGQVELPDRIGGLAVTELGPYVFSEVVRRQMPGEKYLAEVIGLTDEAQRTAGQPETERPETKQPETGRPETEQPETEWPELGQLETERPETEQLETALPDDRGGWKGDLSAKDPACQGGDRVCEKDLAGAQALPDGTPALCGDALRWIRLPKGLRKIGAYAFYNCARLERLDIPGSLQDLGAGLFTGCYGVGHLRVYMVSGKKSCLKELLAELKQTLRVELLEEDGRLRAKLLFPEYYEESIENTPARILTQEMHGCGHRYRNAFNGTEFQYLAYDKLFPHIQVQEGPQLVTELVLGRLLYPVQLMEDRRQIYEAYAAAHGKEIVQIAEREKDLTLLRAAAGAPWCREACLADMLEEGRKTKDPQVLGILMDIRHRKKAERRRRFSL